MTRAGCEWCAKHAVHATAAEQIGAIGNAALYRVTMSDGGKLTVTVPPRDCQNCGGEGLTWGCEKCGMAVPAGINMARYGCPCGAAGVYRPVVCPACNGSGDEA
jgi:hypothetical protein